MLGCSVAEWLASWTQVQKGLDSNAVVTLSGDSLRQTVHIHRASVHQAPKLLTALVKVARVTAGLAEVMAAYCRVHDSRHLQADCQEPGSAPEPYTQQSSMGYLFLLVCTVSGTIFFDILDICKVIRCCAFTGFHINFFVIFGDTTLFFVLLNSLIRVYLGPRVCYPHSKWSADYAGAPKEMLSSSCRSAYDI